jgi:hypothetical protein
MVVMSSALVGSSGVGCGGVAADQQDDDGDPGDGDLGDPSGNGGTVGSGGTSNSGGTLGSGGDLVSVGGTTSIDVVSLPELDCPPEQLSCISAVYHYAQVDDEYVSGYALPDDCTCDEERPVSPDECELGEQFTCWRMAFLDENAAFDQTYRLSCECVPDVESCSVLCESLSPNLTGGGDGIDCEETEDANLVLCGAGWVVLK